MMGVGGVLALTGGAMALTGAVLIMSNPTPTVNCYGSFDWGCGDQTMPAPAAGAGLALAIIGGVFGVTGLVLLVAGSEPRARARPPRVRLNASSFALSF